MTDLQASKEQSRIRFFIKKWAKILRLADWSIRVQYTRDAVCVDDGTGYEIGAKVTTSWQYKMMNLEFNLQSTINASISEVEKIVVHELCHAVVNEMREWCGENRSADEGSESAIAHEERVVTELTNILIGLDGRNNKNVKVRQ